MEMLRDILTSNGGAFAIVIAILAAVGYALVQVTKWQCEMKSATERTQKVENNLDSIKTDIHYIKGTLDVLKSNMPNALTQAHSPVSLTQRGREQAEKMGVRELVAKNWDKIVAYIDACVASKNAYDIQQFCIERASISPESFFAMEDVAMIKNFAYQNGQPLAYYGGMIGVIIRDKYFEFKGIPLEQVDENDPNR